ncbi:adenine phosphoribosyltransferase [Candidatus Micrarchaeota archaeon CG08_land_8_20_14_0_20_59_11]|nr:MAG: adenine phosphoribosyltransferase [Candidatus Micrarchaeota archaeon CG08_land_8_20_14_0_20_59_11]
MDLSSKIRNVPDFPKKGIGFKDITTLLKDRAAFRDAVKQLSAPYRGESIDLVVGVESRGFILGAAVAHELGVGFVPLRKPGKLPYTKIRQEYALEYGTDAIEIHEDAIAPGERVLLVDDLLATGGTAKAACDLIEKLGGKIVGLEFLIELSFLNGREKLGSRKVRALIEYDSE